MDGNILRSVLFGGFFALIFGGVGLYLLANYLKARRESIRSLSWASTTGRIAVSSVQFKDSHGAEINTYNSYLPHIEYTYTVLGSQYCGRRISFGMEITGTRSIAMKITDRYPAGAETVVYFNPENPSEAVLEREVWNKTGAMVMICVFLILGISSCFYSIMNIFF